MSENEALKVLFINDGNTTLAGIKNALIIKGVVCQSSNNPEEAINALRTDKFDVVIANLNVSKMNAIDIYKEIRVLDPDVHVILYSENDPQNNLSQLSNYDHFTYMIQSSDEKELMKTLSVIERKIADSKEKARDIDRLSLNIRNLEEILKLFKTLLKK